MGFPTENPQALCRAPPPGRDTQRGPVGTANAGDTGSRRSFPGSSGSRRSAGSPQFPCFHGNPDTWRAAGILSLPPEARRQAARSRGVVEMSGARRRQGRATGGGTARLRGHACDTRGHREGHTVTHVTHRDTRVTHRDMCVTHKNTRVTHRDTYGLQHACIRTPAPGMGTLLGCFRSTISLGLGLGCHRDRDTIGTGMEVLQEWGHHRDTFGTGMEVPQGWGRHWDRDGDVTVLEGQQPRGVQEPRERWGAPEPLPSPVPLLRVLPPAPGNGGGPCQPLPVSGVPRCAQSPLHGTGQRRHGCILGGRGSAGGGSPSHRREPVLITQG